MTNRIRLVSGLILFAFLTTHLINHSLGTVSIDAAERGLLIFYSFWGNPGVLPILALAFVVHVAMALVALYRRRTLSLRGWEAAQTALGFLIPIVLIGHVVNTRAVTQTFDVEVGYRLILLAYWVTNPVGGLLQALLVIVGWAHGAIGLRFWLLTKVWFRPWRAVAGAVAIVVPVLALAGYVSAGTELRRMVAADPTLLEQIATDANVDEAVRAWAGQVTGIAFTIYLGAILAVLAARRLRHARGRRRRAGAPVIHYDGGRHIPIPPGATALEAIRRAGVPHASVCGGRGRCSTCRVRVRVGQETLHPPEPAEQRVLARIGAAGDVRLACQIRPTADLDVEPLLPANVNIRDALVRPGYLAGEEREIAVLFADLRGFTTLSDGRLPYDVVYVLNRYFAAMGHAVEEAGGRIDKFIGDGVMALFGIERGPAAGARSAIEAVRGFGRAIDELNAALAGELDQPLTLAVGLHAGQAIVGEMGHGRARSLTAIGDVVNVASRLEGLAKERNAAVVLSETVLTLAGIDARDLVRETVAVRGRTEPVPVRIAAGFAAVEALVLADAVRLKRSGTPEDEVGTNRGIAAPPA